MNHYVGLDRLKRDLGVTGSSLDAQLFDLSEAASRTAEGKNAANRFFYAKKEARIFDGSGHAKLLIPDLLTVTTLKTDEDSDGTFEKTWAEGVDFELVPRHKVPRTEVRAIGRSDFRPRKLQRFIEIDGLWGYGNGESADPFEAVGSLTASSDDATDQVDFGGTGLEIGQTVQLDDEQMFLKSLVSGNTFKVDRGVNGTDPATHTDAAVRRAVYPAGITSAVIWLVRVTFQNKRALYESETLGRWTYRKLAEKTLQDAKRNVFRPYRRRVLAAC